MFDALLHFEADFSHDAPKLCIYDAVLHGKAGFLMTRPNTRCIFDALLHFEAGFLMTHQKRAYSMHYYISKQVFFSHDAPKTCIIDAFYLDLFYGKVKFGIFGFLWEKVTTVDFSETIAASDQKGSRRRHLIEYMKICFFRSVSSNL